jgi:hypothetical protein
LFSEEKQQPGLYQKNETLHWCRRDQDCTTTVKAYQLKRQDTMFGHNFLNALYFSKLIFHAAGRYQWFCMIQNPPGT